MKRGVMCIVAGVIVFTLVSCSSNVEEIEKTKAVEESTEPIDNTELKGEDTLKNEYEATKEVVIFAAKDYILHGQNEIPSAGQLKWLPELLETADCSETYDVYVIEGGEPTDHYAFAEYLTFNAPIQDNWEEAVRKSVRENYGHEIIRFELIGEFSFTAYVLIEGDEIDFVTGSMRTGDYHG